MSNYFSLKTSVQGVIKTNGSNAITGSVLQQALIAMINSLGADYQFAGVAIPSTTPGSTDQRVFYIALEAGTYTGFGNTVLTSGQVGIFTYGSSWSYTVKTLVEVVDNLVTNDATKPLSAKQGKALNDNKMDKSDVVDNLSTDDATKPLSAKQGKALNDNKMNKSDVVDNLTTNDGTKPLSAKQGKILNEEKVNTSDIVDNVTTNNATKPLSAKQGKALQDSKVNKSDVVDNLTTNDATKPLSAKQGKTIRDLLNAGYQFMGVATQSTNPGAVTEKIFYLCGSGTYPYFSNIVIGTGYLGVLIYDGSWDYRTIQVGVQINVIDNLSSNDPNNALAARQGKILNENINQLAQLISSMSGIFYGVFTSTSALPVGITSPGYAYVGETAPFHIYTFRNGSWVDSGATVDDISGENGLGLEDIYSLGDGTVTYLLTNGDYVNIDFNHTHTEYYNKSVESTNPSGGFLPDVAYNLGIISGTVVFSLATEIEGQLNHYFWIFSTGASVPTITWPTGITWAAGSAPTISSNCEYEISILGGVAYYSVV